MSNLLKWNDEGDDDEDSDEDDDDDDDDDHRGDDGVGISGENGEMQCSPIMTGSSKLATAYDSAGEKAEGERKIQMKDEQREGVLAVEESKVMREEEVKEGKIDMGSCLIIKASLDSNVSILVIIDSGAGVTVIGKRFMEKWESSSKGKLVLKPIDLKISGVYSGAALTASGVTSFDIHLNGAPKPLRVTAIVVPEWSGELLIGWSNLRELGLGFRDGRDGKPESVLLRRIGADCPIVEGGDEEEVLMASEIGG